MNRQQKEKKLILLKEKKKREAKKTYLKYVEYVHEGRWIPGKHLVYICDKVEKLINNELYNDKGENVQILIVQMPPQHGKSQSITETLPSYFIGKWPDKRVIEVSYGDDLARRFGRANKRKVQQFGHMFNIELASDSRSDTEFQIKDRQGSMISRGIMAGITGQPGDLIIIDDPIKNRQEADSETYRERLWEEWLNSLKTRLSANGKVILILTRWHEDDLAGRIITHEKRVQTINLPCEAEENDPLSRRIGEALFPEIGKDNKWLKDFKEGYNTAEGSRAWLALYQGRPSANEGNIIKRHWWKYWKYPNTELPPVTVKLPDGTYKNIEAEELPEYWDQQLQSWDCAFKDSEHNDYVCGGVWGRRIAKYYLLDLLNERMDIVQTMNAIETFADKWPKALRKLIEGKANGPAVVQMLRKKLSGMIEVEPEGGKETRAAAVSPAIEAGNVYLPHPLICPWVNEFLNQCSSFPNATHDDMVDMTTQALNQLIYRSNDTYKQDEIPHGTTWSAGELRMKGYKDYQIRRMVKDGHIKLIGKI